MLRSNQVAGGPLRYIGLQMVGVWQEACPIVCINLYLRWLVSLHITQKVAKMCPIICSDRSLTRLEKTSVNADNGI